MRDVIYECSHKGEVALWVAVETVWVHVGWYVGEQIYLRMSHLIVSSMKVSPSFVCPSTRNWALRLSFFDKCPVLKSVRKIVPANKWSITRRPNPAMKHFRLPSFISTEFSSRMSFLFNLYFNKSLIVVEFWYILTNKMVSKSNQIDFLQKLLWKL